MSHKFLEFAEKQNLDKNRTLRPLAEPQWDSRRSVFASVLAGDLLPQGYRESMKLTHVWTWTLTSL